MVTEVFDDAGASLGSVALPVACEDPAAAHVRRALALLHNMTHVEAENAFRMATEADPGCALGYWGQAASWVHPVWPDVPTDEQFSRGWETASERSIDGAEGRSRRSVVRRFGGLLPRRPRPERAGTSSGLPGCVG